MRLLKVLAFCLPLLLVTAACAPKPGPVYQEMLDISFKGQNINRMVDGFGPPDKKADGAYTWEKKYSWETGGFWYECTNIRNVYDNDGNVIGYFEDDATCYAEKRTHTNWCNTTAFFDQAKIVTSFDFDGSNMDYSALLGVYDTGCFINMAASPFSSEPEMYFRKYGKGVKNGDGWRFISDKKKLSQDFLRLLKQS